MIERAENPSAPRRPWRKAPLCDNDQGRASDWPAGSDFGLQMYRIVPDSNMFVGLPCLTAKYLYMLPVEEDMTAEPQGFGGIGSLRFVEDQNAVQSLMLVEYTIRYL
jgi:hypothetical protein